MSTATAVGLVSSSLRNMLASEMHLNLAIDVSVLAPDEPGGDRRVNLFLYRIEQNPFLRNGEPGPLPADPSRLVPAPLCLELSYLLTPYAPNDPVEGNATAHQVLGEAMRVLYQNPVLPERYLEPGLQDAVGQLQVTMKSLDPEELSRIWTTFGKPYRLSVLYRVSTVRLDVDAGLRTAVPARVRSVGVPAVSRPPEPPVVLSLAPTAVAAGGTVTFTGAHLAGSHGTARIGGRAVLTNAALDADTVDVPVPADLPSGFYEARLDVAGLARGTFTLEVTA